MQNFTVKNDFSWHLVNILILKYHLCIPGYILLHITIASLQKQMSSKIIVKSPKDGLVWPILMHFNIFFVQIVSCSTQYCIFTLPGALSYFLYSAFFSGTGMGKHQDQLYLDIVFMLCVTEMGHGLQNDAGLTLHEPQFVR